MTHREARLLLADLATERVDVATRSNLLSHLASCAECTTWLETYQLLQEGLGGLRSAGGGTAHPSSDLLARWAASRHHLDVTSQREVLKHLVDCKSCHGDVISLKAALRAARLEQPVANVLALRRGAIRRRAMLLAAAAAAALLLFVSWPQLERLDSLRGPAADGLVAGDLEIHGQELEGRHHFEGGGTMVLRDIQVRHGAEVTFSAGERLALGNGVTIGSGSRVVFKTESVAREGSSSATPENRDGPRRSKNRS